MPDVVHRMHAEWHHLTASPRSTATLHRWAALEPALAGCTTLADLLHIAHDRDRPQHADQVLAALARLAATDSPHHHGGDQLAARVLLQLLLPGAARLARTLATMLGGYDTAMATVLTELTIGIRTYPWQRRPAKVAANLLLDTRQRITRRHQRTRCEITLGLDPHPSTPTTDDNHHHAELHDLLRWAIRTDALNPYEAQLLVAWHVRQLTIPELVSTFGKSRTTLFEHRHTAELKLRNALARTGI